jgi:hypothetical protein
MQVWGNIIIKDQLMYKTFWYQTQGGRVTIDPIYKY